MQVPGPMGDSPSPSSPPTPSKPQPGQQNQGVQQLINSVDPLVNSQLAPILAGLTQQQTALTDQGLYAGGMAGAQIGQLGAGLQQTLAQLGLQRTGLLQQGQYEHANETMQRDAIAEAMANLSKGYGFQQQQFGQEQGQITSSGGASGTSASGTQQRAMQGLGLQEREAKQNYLYSQDQLQDQLKQLGLTSKYQQQQLQNALKGLGIQATGAERNYGYGVQGINDALGQQQASLFGQQGALSEQGAQQSTGILMSLLSALTGKGQ